MANKSRRLSGARNHEEPRQPRYAHLYCALPLETSPWKKHSFKEKETEDGAKFWDSLMTYKYSDSSCLSVLSDEMTGRSSCLFWCVWVLNSGLLGQHRPHLYSNVRSCYILFVVYAAACICGSQRTTCRNWLSPSTMWAWQQCLYLMDHLKDPRNVLKLGT